MPKSKVEKVTTPTPESKIKEISADVKKQMTVAQKIVVATANDVVKATEFLSGIKARLKKIEELRTQFVKPLNDHVKNINAMFKEQSAPLEQIESKVKRAVADFKLEEDRKAAAEEARLAKIRDNANAKREEKGLDPIETPVASVERSDQTVRTESGRSTTTKVWKFEIEAYSKLPQTVLEEVLYLAKEAGLHDRVIRKMVADGAREISGVRIYEDYQVGVRAN